MTGVTRWNKAVTPAGGDGWNLTTDVGKALDSANLLVVVSSVAERNALNPPGGKYAGMAVARADLGGLIEVLDTDLVTWTRGIQHSEFTGSTVPTPGASWGPGPLTRDTGQDRNGGIFTSPSNDRIALPAAGLYVIRARVQLSVGAVGTTWVAITNDTNTFTYTSFDIQPGNATGPVSIPNFLAQTAQNIRIVFYSSSTPGGYTLTSRVAVSKIG